MPLLVLENVSFTYPSGFGLRGIHLEVRRGSFTALIGPNGSGKSTLVRLISKLLEPDGGRIALAGKPLTEYTPRELARQMAVIPSENYFEFPFRVIEVVAMGRFPHLGRLQRMSTEDSRIVARSLQMTQVEPLQDRQISQLSSGERQRVLIARALAQRSPLLVLDEPNAHLDIHHQIAIFRLLRRLNRRQGMTIIVVLHDLTAAATFCDTVALMHQGELAGKGPPRQVITAKTIRAIYGADVLVHPGPGGIPTVTYLAEEAEPVPGPPQL